MMPGGQVPLAGWSSDDDDRDLNLNLTTPDHGDYDNEDQNHDHDCVPSGQQGLRGSMHELNRNFLRFDNYHNYRSKSSQLLLKSITIDQHFAGRK